MRRSMDAQQADAAAFMRGNATLAQFGVGIVRPEWAVVMGDREGPSATEMAWRMAQAESAIYQRACERGLQADQMVRFWAQPGAIIPTPAREPFLTTGRAICIVIATTTLGLGLFLQAMPLIASGVAGFGFIGVWAFCEFLPSIGAESGVATFMGHQTYRAAPRRRPTVRCAVVLRQGFGGYGLNP